MIELRALGTAEIHTGTATLTPSQEIVFAAACFLILERGTPVSRARLASLLWPRATDRVRAHRLRQTLLQLKKLGFGVEADRNNLAVSSQNSWSDVEALLQNAFEVLGQTASLEFLPGYSPRMSENLRDWVDAKR